jgi:hypothetical protein
MNCWKVELPGKCVRYTANEADAREFRNAIMEEYQAPKKSISIDPAEVPTTKAELIDYLNVLAGVKDLVV